jgi:hypothetical protein
VIKWRHNFDGARSLFNASMKTLFQSGTRELMTHLTMGNVKIVISELG